jgi:PAS domain S-box-containing protein
MLPTSDPYARGHVRRGVLPSLARLRAGFRRRELAARETQLRTLMSNVPGAIYRCANDADWTMEFISADIERISGYPPADFIGSATRSYASVIHPGDREQVERDVAEAVREGRQFALEYRIVRRDGGVAWVLERGQQVSAADGRQWLDGMIFDVTERRQAQEALYESRRVLALVEDRERIAQELHDGIIQSLFGIGMRLQAAELALDRPEEARGLLRDGIAGIDGVISDVRAYVLDLRPALLADRELDEALTRLVDEFSGSCPVVVVQRVDRPTAAALTAHAPDVLQMAREALSNVRRHAEATTCRVSLRTTGGAAVLEVDDDGRGFDPAAPTAGQGMRNLAARAARLGGRLDVDTGEHGTTVTIRLPLPS